MVEAKFNECSVNGTVGSICHRARLSASQHKYDDVSTDR